MEAPKQETKQLYQELIQKWYVLQKARSEIQNVRGEYFLLQGLFNGQINDLYKIGEEVDKTLRTISRAIYPNICAGCGWGYRGKPYIGEDYVWPLCLSCTRQFQLGNQVQNHLRRTRKAGLPATLTLKQWIGILEHFGWYCVYCEENKATVLEHFIPISLGGGTTAGNCVPSCNICNTRKNNQHPDEITLFPEETLTHIRKQLRYLEESLAQFNE